MLRTSVAALVVLLVSVSAKELPKTTPLELDENPSPNNDRAERCSSCDHLQSAPIEFAPNIAERLQVPPGAEFHSQSSFQGCSTDKGCAGIKVKDGRIVEKFGDVEAFNAASSANNANEFTFHAGLSGNEVLEGGIPKNGPFWWMKENSPFRDAFENVQKSSFSQSSSVSNGGSSLDLSGNPFLNGDIGKLATGFINGAQSFGSSGGSGSFGASQGAVDISQNPFLNGNVKPSSKLSGSSFQTSQFSSSSSNFGKNNGFGAQGSFAPASGSKFSGYVGSSPSPFTASTAGLNQIETSQKASEFDFDQQQQTQQNIDEIYSQGSSGKFEHNTVDLQQTCAGQGYICVHKAQCNNGVVNTNGAGILQARTKKQYCNTKTEICCRIEIANVPGAGVDLQGVLGVGSATFGSSGADQSIFGSSADNAGGFQSTGSAGSFQSSANGGSFQAGSNGGSFGASAGSGSSQGFGASGSTQGFGASGSTQGFGASGSTQSFGTSGSGSSQGFGASGSGSTQGFGASGTGSTQGFGASGSGSKQGFGATGSVSTQGFGASGSTQGFGASGSTQGFGASGSTQGFGASGFGSSQSFGASGSSSSQGFGAGGSSQGFGASGSSQRVGASGSNLGATASGQNFGTTSDRNNFDIQSTNTFGSSSSSFGTSGQGSQGNFGSPGSGFNAGSDTGSSNTGSTFNFKETSTVNRYNGGGTVNIPATGSAVYKGNTNTQNNFIETTKTETDSFSSGSTANGFYRPGQGLDKPGIPYLPPVVEISSGSSNTVSSTIGYLPPVTSPRPTTSAPAYLPPEINPQGNPSINRPTFVPGPTREPEDTEGSLLLDVTRQPAPKPRQPVQPVISDTPAGCAAALKCTPIEFCTFEGVISNSTVRLTKDQEDFRVPLTDCKDLSSGLVGKCCRDPTYTDPWPTNQLGKWVPGVFGGDDGAYKPDNRGQSNNPAPARVRPARPQTPTTGQLYLNNYRTTEKPSFPYPGPNQVSSGTPQPQPTPQSPASYGVKGGSRGQFVSQGSGQTISQGQGQFGQAPQGQIGQASQGQFSQFGQGQIVSQGQGEIVKQGQGAFVSQGQGAFVSRGQGATVSEGQGAIVSQEQGQSVSQGQGQIVTQGQGGIVSRGQGAIVNQGQGAIASQGQGAFGSQGQGAIVSQGQGAIVSQGQGAFGSQSQGASGQFESTYSESRVSLTQYNAGSQCGLEKGQKPYGNRNDLEVDFAEIPWQAMILLQTNRSLLCGGVITRPDVVLTSAACVDGLQAKHVMIKGGEWKLGIDEEPLPFQIVQVKTILRHPGYRSGSLQNDVAILVLAEKLRLAQNIYPICLPNAGDTLDGFYNGAGECVVTGWGKQVLQVNIPGAILHSVNISLINPGECQSKISQDYPHLLEQYDRNSCACGQPTNPINNICKVDSGSALACTTGDGHFVLRGIYSWDSGCQAGNQLAAFYKFDLEWYEWAIGLSENFGFGQLQQFNQQSQYTSGTKGGFGGFNSGVKGAGFSKFSQSAQSSFSENQGGKFGFNSQIPAVKYQQNPGSGSAFSASYSSQEKQFYQSKPQIVTYTTKPEIFTYTTKPKIVTYTTKPQIVTYETSGSGVNPQFVAPGVTFNPTFKDAVGNAHALAHGAQCQCLENGK